MTLIPPAMKQPCIINGKDHIQFLFFPHLYLQGALFVIITPIGILGSGNAVCDLKTKYIVKNLTTGKFIKCIDVTPCGPGEEPETPSGSVIGIHQIVGHCSVCKKGTYSATKDTEPCKNCKGASCFDHQVVKGSCPINKPDRSYCTDECEVGYVMNKKKTACEPNVTTNPTQSNTDIFKSPSLSKLQTTKPSAINSTEKAADEFGDRSRFSPAAIAIIVVSIIFFALIVIVVYYRCSRRTAINSKG